MPGVRSVRRLATRLRQTGLRVMVRDQALDLYRPFMHDNRFIFESENIRTAWRRLREEDRRKLPWNPEEIDWEDYWITREVEGVRKWVQAESALGV